jgi:amino acid adenylation domain-containing protein
MSTTLIEGFRLSPQQRRIWLLQEGAATYRSQIAIEIEGNLDVSLLRRSVADSIARHEVLRTRFQLLPGMKIPLQVVGEDCVYLWSEIDLRELSLKNEDKLLDDIFKNQGKRGFDFFNGPLIDLWLARLGHKHILFVNLPSICADAWSLSLLPSELSRAYGISPGQKDAHNGVVPYVQFCEWQTELLSAEFGEKGREFWRRRNPQIDKDFRLPLERFSDSDAAPEYEALYLDLSETETATIENRAAERGANVEVFLLACWQILLSKTAGEAAVPVSVYCNGRVYEEMETSIGLYAKWPILWGRVQESDSFLEVLERTRDSLSDCHEWQEFYDCDLGGEDVSRPNRNSIGFEFREKVGDGRVGELIFKPYKFYSNTDAHSLKLSCVRMSDGLRLVLQYDRRLHNLEMMERALESYRTLVRNALNEDLSGVIDLEVLGEKERQLLLFDWNATCSGFDTGECLHGLFKTQVERAPESIAVSYDGDVISFAELNRRANRLGRYLRRKGMAPESVVGLMVERGIEMVIGVLGIMKAGGAYLPLDPFQPTERLSLMLKDGRADLVILQEKLSRKFDVGIQEIYLDKEWDEVCRESHEDLDVNLSSSNLAYVIFTSGSTGRPKGVSIEHRSVINLTAALKKAVYQNQDKTLRVSLNAPLTFDSSVKQLAQLLNGNSLHIVPEDVRRDGKELLCFVEREGIEALDCTPSQLRLMVAARDGVLRTPAKKVLIGGEEITEQLWRAATGDPTTEYYNVYGPTECTVDATFKKLEEGENPSIGRPLSNVRLYVLDGNMRAVGIGAIGELYIAGVGVGRGYLSQAGMTAERFLPHPYGHEPGERLYKTGDRVRYGLDGNLEYIGRVDNQVKLRGYRIELGEIEAALLEHPAVAESIAILREEATDNPRLVAYVEPVQNQTITINLLRNYVREKLPEYMMPASFVILEKLPLTPNGKISRQHLPPPDWSSVSLEAGLGDHLTVVEELLAEIWSEALGVKRSSKEDNFFEVGGHSLLAMQLISRVREAFRVEIPLRAIFEEPTIARLAKYVEAAKKVGESLDLPPIRPISRDQELPLSFAQQRLWFIHQLEPDSPAYNIPFAVRFAGALNLTALERSMNEVMRRHEALRTIFRSVAGWPAQVIKPVQRLNFPVVDLSELSKSIRDLEMKRLISEEGGTPFDLAEGPLLRLTLLRIGEQEHVVLLTLHHIVSDGWSTSVLTREVGVLYDAFNNGQPSPLPDLAIQYADFASWQRAHLKGEVLDRHLAYWKAKLGDHPPALKFPWKREQSDARKSRGGESVIILPENLSESLRRLSRQEGATLFMTMLAAFKVLLYRYTGQPDVAVCTPIANRNRPEIEKLIGFFVNLLVLRTDLSGNPRFRDVIDRVRECTLDAYVHQELPFERLVEELRPERGPNHMPFSQILFTQEFAAQKTIELPNLSLSSIGGDNGRVKFDLALFVIDRGRDMAITAEYSSDMFEAAKIVRLLVHFRELLQQITSNADERILELRLLTDEDTHGYSLIDFPDADLSQADFDNLVLELDSQ